jgi:hypothetical protein
MKSIISQTFYFVNPFFHVPQRISHPVPQTVPSLCRSQFQPDIAFALDGHNATGIVDSRYKYGKSSQDHHNNLSTTLLRRRLYQLS